MRRFLTLVTVAALTALVIAFVFHRPQQNPNSVAKLLPKETLALLHVPDFNKALADWRQADLYQLWSEPAVQSFLQKPRRKIPAGGSVGQKLQDLQSLEMKDSFIAVIGIEFSAWKIVGGFRSTEGGKKTEAMVANWMAQASADPAEIKHESLDYEGHRIRTDTSGVVRLFSVHDGQWFLFANDLEQLKPLLDRVDGRRKEMTTALAADKMFAPAAKRMPTAYAALAYARLDQLVEKFLPLAEKSATAAPEQVAMVRQLRNFCGATSFEGGKIRDTIFVGMPPLATSGDLARASLAIATKATFLYAAGFLNLAQPPRLPANPSLPGLMGALPQILATASASGITTERWNAAFGSEFGLVGDWPATSHWPSFFASLPVKDAAAANKILTTLTTADSETAAWTRREVDGIYYFSTQSSGMFFSLAPTVGLSDRMLVAGIDPASVEAALKRSQNKNSELAAANDFQNAERAVPAAKQAFIYIDPARVYARFDAVVRPMLFMSAAFLPGLRDTVDFDKLPDAGVITRHLSPIVMSQRYDGDGYVSESVGPITVYQTMMGAAALGTAAMIFYRQHDRESAAAPPYSAPPLASPSPDPDDTP
ncbi:MAG: hypothetical protein ABJB09_00815 [Verrucomicrobiota bacterium]